MSCNTENSPCRAGKIIAGIIFGIGAAFLFGLVIMLLWNELMPHLFEVPLITYWQAFGLALLGRLIFGGVGGGSHRGSSRSYHSHPRTLHGKARNVHDCAPDHIKDWHHYDEWWESEGEQAFRDYAKKAKGPEVVKGD